MMTSTPSEVETQSSYTMADGDSSQQTTSMIAIKLCTHQEGKYGYTVCISSDCKWYSTGETVWGLKEWL